MAPKLEQTLLFLKSGNHLLLKKALAPNTCCKHTSDSVNSGNVCLFTFVGTAHGTRWHWHPWSASKIPSIWYFSVGGLRVWVQFLLQEHIEGCLSFFSSSVLERRHCCGLHSVFRWSQTVIVIFSSMLPFDISADIAKSPPPPVSLSII